MPAASLAAAVTDTVRTHATVPPDPSAEDPFVAAAWALARQDRGFSPQERAAFDRWLHQAREHAAATATLEQVWRQLDRLSELCPPSGDAPDPHLLDHPGAGHRSRIDPG